MTALSSAMIDFVGGDPRARLGNARASSIGTRIVGGRMATVEVNGSGFTYELLLAVASEFDAVRLVLAQGHNASASSPTGVTLGAAAVASPSQADVNGASWAVQSGVTLLASPGSGRRSYTFSNWLPIASVPRNDGGTLPLVALRASIPAATLVNLGSASGADDFRNWASHPSGRIFRIRRQQITTGVTTPSSFTTETNTSSSPIIGVQYMARGRVYSIVGFGDSITEGRGTYIGEGWGQPACIEAQQALGAPVEWSNLGWSGIAMPTISAHITDAMQAGLMFSAAFVPNASPNDFGTPITQANILSARTNRAIGIRSLVERGIPVIAWTVLPTNPSVKNYGASDSLRLALNTSWIGTGYKGEIIVDFANALSGPPNVSGQTVMLAGSTADNIHPNDTGNSILAGLASDTLASVLVPVTAA